MVPELVGSAAALAGLYRQKDSGGVFDRLEDTERGVLSAQIQMWCCLAASAAHLAALTVEADRPSKGLKRARAARNLGHEYALLSSIYLQVASGFSDIYRLYITGVASFALFAAGFYRCIETFVAGNFATTRIASVISECKDVFCKFNCARSFQDSHRRCWIFFLYHRALPCHRPNIISI